MPASGRAFAFAILNAVWFELDAVESAAHRHEEQAMSHSQSAIENLEPDEVSRLLQARSIVLVDVREPAEFASERIAGALLYPLSTFDASMLPDDGTRRIVFHCGSGKRSLTAAERRLAAGQKQAAHLRGGLAAWKAAGLPTLSAP